MNDFWYPTFAAISAILDVLPKELQDKAIAQLQQMAQCCEDRGDRTSAYFCRAVSGEEFPEPKPKPQLRAIRGGRA